MCVCVCPYAAKRSGCERNWAYISSRERFSRMKAGRVMRVRSMPTRTCDAMCMITLRFCAMPSGDEGGGREREEGRALGGKHDHISYGVKVGGAGPR